jgi:methionine biosynthesis protein MetW
VRPDLKIVAGMVPAGSRVLDLGCGDGALLAHLIAERGCYGHGVEIDGDAVLACIAAGVPVTEGAIENVLRDFADGAFDIVLLSWTLQTTRRRRGRDDARRPGRRRLVPELRALAAAGRPGAARPHAELAGAPAVLGRDA